MDINKRDEIISRLNNAWDKIHAWDNREIDYIEKIQDIIKYKKRSLTIKEEQEWNELCTEYESLLEELKKAKSDYQEFTNGL